MEFLGEFLSDFGAQHVLGAVHVFYLFGWAY